jgi:hypothetical protein
MAGCTVKRSERIEVVLNTQGQTREKIHEIVDAILRQNTSIIECGIMAYLSIDLGVRSEADTQTSSELSKLGVVSLKTIHSA